jgi:signal transduction histidine kinase
VQIMNTTEVAIERSRPRSGSALPIAVVAAMLAIALSVVALSDDAEGNAVAVVLVAAWAAAAVFVASRRPAEPLWAWTVAVALVGASALLATWAIPLVPLVVGAFIVAAPDGILPSPRTRWLGGIAAIVAAVAVAVADDDNRRRVIVIESIVLGVLALSAYLARYRRANAVARSRLQWIGWGVVVAGALALAVGLVDALLDWPSEPGRVALAATLFVPLAVALSAIDALAVRVDRLLVRTIEAGGLVVMIGLVYLVVVLGFGDAPDSSERRVLGLSMVAGIIAALLYAPTRNRLSEAATGRVYGQRQAPDEPLQTFGARMSRAIPLEELMLQLAESLKKSMQLSEAEVWTGAAGVLECIASVPYREPPRIRLTEDEIAVLVRARVSGNAWLQVWLPALLAAHEGRMVRVAPLAHSGELLGLIVVARPNDAAPFTEEQDRTLTELARPVALALHNSRLDTALQASLDDLRVANEELRASRARIVAASDQSRRQIERNLHDGAQQHLVALAVKLGLARQLLEADPSTLGPMLEELRSDAQATLSELRELAHGIYPPLLMDRGLPEALRAAANRAVLPTDVSAEVGRYPADVEAAVYFCCLEAMQNAGKHAGEGARIMVTIEQSGHELCFEVADNGPGFDARGAAGRGHGFVNMADRVGAIGGTIEIDSAPGAGTRIKGRLPVSATV